MERCDFLNVDIVGGIAILVGLPGGCVGVDEHGDEPKVSPGEKNLGLYLDDVSKQLWEAGSKDIRQGIVNLVKLTETTSVAVDVSGVTFLLRGTNSLDIDLDTPPSSPRQHSCSRIAHPARAAIASSPIQLKLRRARVHLRFREPAYEPVAAGMTPFAGKALNVGAKVFIVEIEGRGTAPTRGASRTKTSSWTVLDSFFGPSSVHRPANQPVRGDRLWLLPFPADPFVGVWKSPQRWVPMR